MVAILIILLVLLLGRYSYDIYRMETVITIESTSPEGCSGGQGRGTVWFNAFGHNDDGTYSIPCDGRIRLGIGAQVACVCLTKGAR